MIYFYFLMAMFFSATITVGGRLYNNKNCDLKNVSKLYNMLVPIFAAISWLIIWLFDFSFDIRVLPYSFLYGIGFSCFTVGVLGALKVGSTSLTAFVKQVSLVGVSIWGFVFWDTPFVYISAIGIVLIVISLFFCLFTKNDKGEHDIVKWAFFALLVVVGNAGCAIIQRYQQMAFNYQHKNQLMFFAVLFSAVMCFFLALSEKKTNWKMAIKHSWYFPAITGCSSALSNIFILLLVKHQMSPVILYPGIAVGGLMITILISLFGFREKLRPMQWCGLCIGAVALVLLNL